MKLFNFSSKTLWVAALSFGILATISSCKEKGCMDPKATNYNADAKKDDGSCEYAPEEVEGCTDATATNYNANATVDDGSCVYPTDTNDTTPTPVHGTATKSGKITASETWTSNNIYFLDGKVIVESGATLTIEAGTIIKGKPGQESTASALIIARGGKIMAEGTADKPIIFTAESDNITYDQLVGTNLERTDNNLWGGVIVLGKAPISAENGDTEANIEGIVAEDGYGKYGGSDAADNSGVMKYVSIRHGGITIGEGNEINGLTLGGVGTGTTLENIEVYGTLDDGVEFFGGTVNAKNILVYYQGDDGIDIDMNYSGTVDGFVVIHGDGIGTDEGLEIDGPEGPTHKDGLFTLKNGICKTEGTEGSPGDFKSKAQGNVTNVTFSYGSKDIKIRTGFVDPGVDCDHKSDAYKNLVDGKLKFTGCSLSGGVDVYEGDGTGLCLTELAAAVTDAATKIGTGSGGTISATTTFSWTAAGKRGQL